MPSSSKGSGGSCPSGVALPVQPTQVPDWATRTGCSAVTSPPGLRRQLPGATSSTGNRFATTTKELGATEPSPSQVVRKEYVTRLNGLPPGGCGYPTVRRLYRGAILRAMADGSPRRPIAGPLVLAVIFLAVIGAGAGFSLGTLYRHTQPTGQSSTDSGGTDGTRATTDPSAV